MKELLAFASLHSGPVAPCECCLLPLLRHNALRIHATLQARRSTKQPAEGCKRSWASQQQTCRSSRSALCTSGLWLCLGCMWTTSWCSPTASMALRARCVWCVSNSWMGTCKLVGAIVPAQPGLHRRVGCLSTISTPTPCICCLLCVPPPPQVQWNSEEVSEVKFIELSGVAAQIEAEPEAFTQWCREELALLGWLEERLQAPMCSGEFN